MQQEKKHTALPADDAVQNWFEENIDKECSASSAIYKFRLWLESLLAEPRNGTAYRSQILQEYKQYKENLKFLGGAAEWTKGKVNQLNKVEVFETIKGLSEVITFLDSTCYAYEEGSRDWEKRCVKAEAKRPAGSAGWIKAGERLPEQTKPPVLYIVKWFDTQMFVRTWTANQLAEWVKNTPTLEYFWLDESPNEQPVEQKAAKNEFVDIVDNCLIEGKIVLDELKKHNALREQKANEAVEFGEYLANNYYVDGAGYWSPKTNELAPVSTTKQLYNEWKQSNK